MKKKRNARRMGKQKKTSEYVGKAVSLDCK